MILVRIDDQLRVDPETSQRLIHLLATLNRHVEIALATEEQCRRLNSIGMQERIRKLLICFPRLWIPGWPNLVVVLNDVLVGAVERHGERGARTTGCGLESVVSSRSCSQSVCRHNSSLRLPVGPDQRRPS